MQTIPVSVIVPNYNSGHYLEDCINSINCGRWPAEILIIDDCSTDNSFEVAIRLQTIFSNIRVLKRSENCGAAEARRFGIEASSYPWIAFVDADDILEADALSDAHVTAVSSNADICIWELWRFDSEKEWKSAANPPSFPQTGHEAVLLTLGGWRAHPLGVSKKDLYKKAYQGFSESMVNADELLTRVAFSHANFLVGCKKRYFYRSHTESTTQRINTRRLSSLRSHLWLLRFASQYPEAPVHQMTLDALWEAWFFWKKRALIGIPATVTEVKAFLSQIFILSGSKAWIWRHPKYVVAFVFMLLQVNMRSKFFIKKTRID